MNYPFNLILGSASPRRKALLEAMAIPFRVQVYPVDETYPDHLSGADIAQHIAKLKAEAFKGQINTKDIVLTADTIVCHSDTVLQKPETLEEAGKMLKVLSGNEHQVITAYCLTAQHDQRCGYEETKVEFNNLTNTEIDYYINEFKPLDKAGAYGIQEWIGHIGIARINGSYNNVVGLPTHLIYKTLMAMAK